MKLQRINAIKKLLLPYYTGEQPRSVGEFTCAYNGPNGTHCAFAMACMNPSKLREGVSPITILENQSETMLLKKEYRGLFSPKEWKHIQHVHDKNFSYNSIEMLSNGVEDVRDIFKPKTILC